MPELPEVETVRRRLLTCLPGLVVRDVRVNDARVCDLHARTSCGDGSPGAASRACGGAAST